MEHPYSKVMLFPITFLIGFSSFFLGGGGLEINFKYFPANIFKGLEGSAHIAIKHS